MHLSPKDLINFYKILFLNFQELIKITAFQELRNIELKYLVKVLQNNPSTLAKILHEKFKTELNDRDLNEVYL